VVDVLHCERLLALVVLDVGNRFLLREAIPKVKERPISFVLAIIEFLLHIVLRRIQIVEHRVVVGREDV
jgi:hypothetical protein